ncbi:unnamed protein product, partial [Ranitomeya imitator]
MPQYFPSSSRNQKPENVLGLLHQMDRNKDTLELEHYCILKDGCFIRSKISALGGIYLQGYTVSEQSVNSRRCIIELRPPSEEFKTFYLSAGHAAENKTVSGIQQLQSLKQMCHQIT